MYGLYDNMGHLEYGFGKWILSKLSQGQKKPCLSELESTVSSFSTITAHWKMPSTSELDRSLLTFIKYRIKFPIKSTNSKVLQNNKYSRLMPKVAGLIVIAAAPT